MIILSAILDGVSSRKDKTLKLVFSTNELPPAEMGKVMSLANAYCFLSIKSEDFNPTEKELLQQMKADQMTNTIKTPSQRLRGVLFVLWQNNNEGFDKFDSFYIHKISEIIEHFKTKIP